MPGMRLFGRLSRRLSVGILALIILFSAPIPAIAADTGTYRIADYVVTLEPQPSGQVKITCEQTWQVTGGHIPWITVGLPNSNFSVIESSGAVTKISNANSSGWSGVQLDLDKDYQPGQTFNIKFSVLQGNLLERLPEQKTWRINYTPGWYDNAITDHLKISIIAPVDIESYTQITPQPTLSAGDTVMWDQTSIPKGGHFTVRVESTDGNFLVPSGESDRSGRGINSLSIIVVIVIILIFVAGILYLKRKSEQAKDKEILARIAAEEKLFATNSEEKKKAEKGFQEYIVKEKIQPDEEGKYYDRGYGGYITPLIWAAILSRETRTQTNVNPTPPRNCACACVSCACACACACAGGHGAGCAKKGLHRCKECENTLHNDKLPLAN